MVTVPFPKQKSKMLVLIISLCVVYIIWSLYRDRVTKSILPPKFKGEYPIVGHVLSLISGDATHLHHVMNRLTKECTQLGGVARFMFFRKALYAITDPDDFAKVANTCLEKQYMYKFAKPFMGNGLFSSDLSLWKEHRKLLNPAFSPYVIKGFVGTFNSQSRKLLERLAGEEENTLFNCEHMLSVLGLETVCKTTLGYNIEESQFQELVEKYVVALKQLLAIFFLRFQKLWMYNDYIYSWSALKRKQDHFLATIHTISELLLPDTQPKPADTLCETDQSNTGRSKAKPFREMILELTHNNNILTDSDVKGHVDTIVFGGHDTTATTILYALILLGSYQDVQENVYKELIKVFGNSDSDVVSDDLPKLVYMEAVLNETLRLYPIGSLIARYASAPVTLKNYTIPAGSNYFLSIGGVLRHPIWGPDAHEFKPERWLNPDNLPRNNKAFVAFSYGRRGCIGKTYAMFSMKILLVHVLRRYRVSADVTKLKLKFDPMTKPVSGCEISIETRKEVINHSQIGQD